VRSGEGRLNGSLTHAVNALGLPGGSLCARHQYVHAALADAALTLVVTLSLAVRPANEARARTQMHCPRALRLPFPSSHVRLRCGARTRAHAAAAVAPPVLLASRCCQFADTHPS
jgi:hypothetical protein